jgi:hypothetical protein
VNLRQLTLDCNYASEFSGIGFDLFTKLQHLRKATLWNLTKLGIHHLAAGLPSLRELHLPCCQTGVLEPLSTMSKLEIFGVHFSAVVGNTDFEFLSKMLALRKVELGDLEIKNNRKQLEQLADLPHLEMVTIGSLKSHMEDSDVEPLTKLSNFNICVKLEGFPRVSQEAKDALSLKNSQTLPAPQI